MLRLILLIVIIGLSIYLIAKISKRYDKCTGVVRADSIKENYGQDASIRWGVGQLSGPLFPFGRSCDDEFGNSFGCTY